MHKNVKRATLVLALTPLMSLPVAAMAANAPDVHSAPLSSGVTPKASTHQTTAGRTTQATQTTVTTHTDAPKAAASAVAAQVNGVITIGSTATTAGSSGGTAHAHALDVLGTTVAGGDVTDGSKSGALLATPDNPIGDLELAPWSGSVTHNGGGTQAKAEAALAHAGLLDVLELWLLHSQSQSTWTPDASHGQSSSDGAEANVGGGALDVKVLHAETDSDGKGSSALLVVNGTGIGTNDQLGGMCQVNLDPLADLLCLQASGGKGSDGSTTQNAFVATVTGAVPGATVTGASSSGGHVATPAAGTPNQPKAPQSPEGPLPHTSGPSAGRLPFTGGEFGLMAAYAALATAIGAALTRTGSRRRSVTA